MIRSCAILGKKISGEMIDSNVLLATEQDKLVNLIEEGTGLSHDACVNTLDYIVNNPDITSLNVGGERSVSLQRINQLEVGDLVKSDFGNSPFSVTLVGMIVQRTNDVESYKIQFYPEAPTVNIWYCNDDIVFYKDKDSRAAELFCQLINE
jgi:hypothetical protein